MTTPTLAALSAALSIAFAPMPSSADGLEGAGWRPVSLGSTAPSTQQQIVFDANGRVYGSDGCNRFSGSYSVDASGKLTIDTGSMMATKMGCRDLSVQTATKALMQAMTDVRSYRVDGDRMLLLDASGNTLAELAR